MDGLAKESSMVVMMMPMLTAMVAGRESRDALGAYLEGLLGAITATETGLVATSDEDKPVLLLGAGGQDGLPVLKGHWSDTLLRDSLSQLLDGGGGDGGWHVGLGLVEPSLNTVGQGDLLLCQGDGRKEGDKRSETHLDGYDAC
jgi:hypothetical protein